jgi:cadmium resistance protein CadD (predicted permease)
MEIVPATSLLAAGAFVATNLDDLLVLCVLFLSVRAGAAAGYWKVWLGQYLGLGILTGVSIAAAWALAPVPMQWVGLLGLIPLALGIRGLLAAHRHSGDGPPPVTASVPAVVGVTVANGGDNISVYVPLFHSVAPPAAALSALTFAVLLAVWCTAGFWLTAHPRVIAVFRRAGHWIIPAVYVVLGLVIITRSGIVGMMVGLPAG